MGVHDQEGFAARFDWGEQGLRTLLPVVDLIVIVDVLSFTTAVDVAVARGAGVIPHAFRDESAADVAREKGAALAVSRYDMSNEHPYSLSPRSLAHIPRDSLLVLPSPNGSTLTTLARKTHLLLAGCLRNAQRVARWAQTRQTIGVIAAGELRRDGTLRFAIEDLIGAGAILSHFENAQRSPEADVAVAAFQRCENDLLGCLSGCASGRELAEIGFADDVVMAAELDVSEAVSLFVMPGWYADVSKV